MDIAFTKISDLCHSVEICRIDKSVDRIELNSRSFLRHDLAHFAVEIEIPITGGYWGCVAAGASLSGDGIGGDEIWLAETLAGRVQTLIRTKADPSAYLEQINSIIPDISSTKLAERIHERARQLSGHWRATPYGSEMRLVWPEMRPGIKGVEPK